MPSVCFFGSFLDLKRDQPLFCLNLEEPLWRAFKELAARRRLTLAQLLQQIDAESGHFQRCPSMSSLVRSYVVTDLLRRAR
jgi:predicted DNA-binding ribbon-helix-helix protein